MDGVNQPTFFRTNRPTREFQGITLRVQNTGL